MMLGTIVVIHHQFLLHHIGGLEGRLVGKRITVICRYVRVGGLDRLVDDRTYFIFFLSEDTGIGVRQAVGGTFDIACRLEGSGILLGVHLLREVVLGVVLVPHHRVVYLVGEDIARVVAEVVGEAHHVVEVLDAVRVNDEAAGVDVFDLDLRCAREGVVFSLQHGISLRVERSADHAGVDDGVGLGDELLLVLIAEHLIVPVSDGVVEVVGDVVGHEVLVLAKTQTRSGVGCAVVVSVVGIEVGLHFRHRQLAVGVGRDGQGQADILAVGRGRTCEGGDVLVIDVDATLDVPVVCGHLPDPVEAVGEGVAVVDNAFRVMDEVTGGLYFICCCHRVVGVALVGHGEQVIG